MADVELSTLGATIKTAYEGQSNTNAFTDAEQTKLSGIEASADVTDATNVGAAGAPILSSGAGAPATTPGKVGDIYVDTTNDVHYVATGTSSSADWTEALTSGSAATLSSAVIDAADAVVFFDNSDSDNPKQENFQDFVDIASGIQSHNVNAQTGTSYTLVIGDQNDVVTMNNASANTLTIPTNASVAFPTGTKVEVWMLGAGTTTIAGATGVTLQGNGGSASAGSCDIQTRYAGATLTKIDTNTWMVGGDIDAVA